MAEDGLLDEILTMISESPKLVVAAEPEFGWTALHRAAVFGHTDVLKALIEAGARPSLRDKRRNSPLHDAARGQGGSLPSMVLLVRAGASIDALNTYWETPLHIAVGCSNLPGFSFLLGRGARIDRRDRHGRTPLGAALWQLEGVPKSRKYANQREELGTIIEIIESLGAP